MYISPVMWQSIAVFIVLSTTSTKTTPEYRLLSIFYVLHPGLNFAWSDEILTKAPEFCFKSDEILTKSADYRLLSIFYVLYPRLNFALSDKILTCVFCAPHCSNYLDPNPSTICPVTIVIKPTNMAVGLPRPRTNHTEFTVDIMWVTSPCSVVHFGRPYLY